MTTITPTRFGLKYAPIPTLALEYEEDLGVVEDESGTRSLYVLKETKNTTKHMRKKLHVVELPHLTGSSEPNTIAQQLQKDDHRFLGPKVVKEQQLKRLLQQLVDQLRGAGGFTRGQDHTEAAEEEEDEEELGQSAMDESIAEASVSMDVSKADDESRDEGDRRETNVEGKPRGKFITQDDEDDHDEDEADTSTREHDNGDHADSQTRPAATEEERREAEDDEKKKKALKSDSDGSENEEDDVQSEELEYFSEDGSDEDSF